mgnify:CR=1 FL=1
MKFKRLYRPNSKKLNYLKTECIKLQVKFLIYSLWSKGIVFYFLNRLYSKKNIESFTKIRNYCIESGRSQNLNAKFWLSRIQIRELASCRLITGLKKASW